MRLFCHPLKYVRISISFNRHCFDFYFLVWRVCVCECLLAKKKESSTNRTSSLNDMYVHVHAPMRLMMRMHDVRVC